MPETILHGAAQRGDVQAQLVFGRGVQIFVHHKLGIGAKTEHGVVTEGQPQRTLRPGAYPKPFVQRHANVHFRSVAVNYHFGLRRDGFDKSNQGVLGLRRRSEQPEHDGQGTAINTFGETC